MVSEPELAVAVQVKPVREDRNSFPSPFSLPESRLPPWLHPGASAPHPACSLPACGGRSRALNPGCCLSSASGACPSAWCKESLSAFLEGWQEFHQALLQRKAPAVILRFPCGKEKYCDYTELFPRDLSGWQSRRSLSVRALRGDRSGDAVT